MLIYLLISYTNQTLQIIGFVKFINTCYGLFYGVIFLCRYAMDLLEYNLNSSMKVMSCRKMHKYN